MRKPVCLLILLLLLMLLLPVPALAADGTCAAAVPGAASTWYFAEGYTGTGFQEWLCLANPGTETAPVDVSYVFATGAPLKLHFDLPPASRNTVNINATAGQASDVALVIEAGKPIVAERPIYFTYRGAWPGCSNSPGANSLSTDFAMAEGCTRAGFEEYLCVLNPGSQAGAVSFSFSTGHTLELEVPAASRRTVFVNSVVGAGQDVGFAAHSGVPMVMERLLYFDYGGTWPGGHAQTATAAATEHYFAEGYTGPGFAEWLCLYAPQDTAIHIDYLFDAGAAQSQDLVMAAGSRRTICVNEVVGAGRNVSLRILADKPILAERPMYFNYKGTCRGGTVTAGAAQPSTELFLAEGTTRPGFEEYLCLANPSDAATTVTVTYLAASGDQPTRAYSLPAGSRYTVFVNGEIGSGRDVSIRLTSGTGIVAERSVYFPDYHFDAANAMDFLWQLSGVIGQRMQGTAGDAQAAEWMAGLLSSWGLDVTVQSVPLPDGTHTHNVVAGLPEDPALPTLVVGGHYDTHKGSGSPGANDNGSGTVTVLELARCISVMPARANVRFVLFGGEEDFSPEVSDDHFGSQYYVDSLAAHDDLPDGDIIIDMVGVGE
ncbi:MAG: DUF5719 family protein, partial [Actinobacteria bacterium]|nr:DUF5719 family protein [Actinomycetota bacterium]